MPICNRCSRVFPNWRIYRGKKRNFSKRKFCLRCSPFGKHNTSPLGINHVIFLCIKCGETDSKKFYGHKRGICGRCHNEYTVEKSRENKRFASQKLGGKCVLCGFDKYDVSLDFHHLDPAKKDKNFRSMRGWSKDRILKEMSDCVLVCSNCHHAIHAGLLKL